MGALSCSFIFFDTECRQHMVYSAWWCSWSTNSRAPGVKTVGPTFNSCIGDGGVLSIVSLLKALLWSLLRRALQGEMVVLHWNWTTVRWCLRVVTFFEALCLENLSRSLCVVRRCCWLLQVIGCVGLLCFPSYSICF